MITEKKQFDIGDVLGAITAQTFSSKGSRGLAELMVFMCSFSEVRPSIAKCGESLLNQFPQFQTEAFEKKVLELRNILRLTTHPVLRAYFLNDWLTQMRKKYGNTLEVESFPRTKKIIN
jgi:hypothetical protein